MAKLSYSEIVSRFNQSTSVNMRKKYKKRAKENYPTYYSNLDFPRAKSGALKNNDRISLKQNKPINTNREEKPEVQIEKEKSKVKKRTRGSKTLTYEELKEGYATTNSQKSRWYYRKRAKEYFANVFKNEDFPYKKRGKSK